MTKNVPLFVLVLHLIETTAKYKPCLWLLAQMTGYRKDVKHLSASVIHYACDQRLYLYNTV